MKHIFYATCPRCGLALDIWWDRDAPVETITDDDLRPWCLCPVTAAEARALIARLTESEELGAAPVLHAVLPGHDLPSWAALRNIPVSDPELLAGLIEAEDASYFVSDPPEAIFSRSWRGWPVVAEE